MTSKSLSHVVALVTGGSTGLGAATVCSLLTRGARVMVADLHNISPAATRGTTSKMHGGALCFAETNVTSEEQVERTLDKIEEKYGEPATVAINCAGIALTKKTLTKQPETGSLEDFRKTLEINTVGTFNVCRLVAARIPECKSGVLINTSSIAAYEGQRGQVAYATSKAAISGMTLTMARDLAPSGVRVMGIAPGYFESPLLAGLPESVTEELSNAVPYPSRLGLPKEFGHLVCSIIENDYLNGEVIRLDGALRMPA